ncbi:hypothetical protein [Streptomyces melanogenes]|uniref:hypothetical protein n=1 Tax=Streptomyces melanogenes TaxID=67326 RepID=UPI00167D1A33|nr:hypothetical protein [Streptomyces melanogenes]GGP85695.1 hypothetical protein GCM10010278_75140 [Streptomyces melanogenes]
MKRLVVLTACLVVALGSLGLSVHEDFVGEEQEEPPPTEKIAAAIGCTLDTAVTAEELHEAACAAKGTQYRVMSFATREGEQVWLDEAEAYGGTYLVGPRWVIVCQPEGATEALKAKLGGELQKAPSHGAAHADPHGTGQPHTEPHESGHPTASHGTAPHADPSAEPHESAHGQTPAH